MNTKKIKLVTYNIHRAIGWERQPMIERTAQILAAIKADIYILQEVSYGKNDESLTTLTQRLKAKAYQGDTFKDEQGKYGNLVLTSLPVQSWETINLSVPGREPRQAISIKFSSEKFSLHLVATHLGLRPFERRIQTSKLLSLFKNSNEKIKILAGDFNEWLRWGRPLQWLRKEFGQMPAPATFPAHRPWFALDRFWIKPASNLLKLQSINTIETRLASDHIPLVATIKC
jgi:endonuclease/exonuclease/phosphatase family metal-dependent hydrolase